MLKVIGGMNTVFQSNQTGVNSSSQTFFANFVTKWGSSFDEGIALALGLCYIITLTTAYNIQTNPGYFWISLFFMFLILGIIAIFGQIFDLGTNNYQFITERASMPATTFIVTNGFAIGVAGALLLLMVLFAKVFGR
jgi:hypothetical protein